MSISNFVCSSLPGYLRCPDVVYESGRAGGTALPDVREVEIVVVRADSPDLAAARRRGLTARVAGR